MTPALSQVSCCRLAIIGREVSMAFRSRRTSMFVTTVGNKDGRDCYQVQPI